MYIPDFWCGVFATVIVEVVAIVIAAVVCSKRGKR